MTVTICSPFLLVNAKAGRREAALANRLVAFHLMDTNAVWCRKSRIQNLKSNHRIGPAFDMHRIDKANVF